MLAAAGKSYALKGQVTRADRLLARLDAATSGSARSYDLRVRLAIDPTDRKAQQELQRLSRTDQAEHDRDQSLAVSGAQLYDLHCSACHGENGDGNGRAARYLYPKPRELSTGSFRLVSTLNGVPTPEDIEDVIERGMAGTSMRSFENLKEKQRQQLTQEVLRLRRKGILDQFTAMLRNEEEAIEQSEINEIVALSTTPGEAVTLPTIGPSDPQSVVRGRAV
jgi:mono/diheme cytochrome c family protein